MIDIYTEKHSKSSKYNMNWFQGITLENVKRISSFREEPEELLQFRLQAFDIWSKMKEPHWIEKDYHISYDKLFPYSKMDKNAVDRIKDTFDILEINQKEKNRISNIALDLVIDSESILTTKQKELDEYGIIFCSMKEASLKYADILMKYLATVVAIDDNFFSALNSAFFSDGTFCYIPKNTKCPFDLSSYFRIDSLFGSQFERTLIIADEGSEVNYLEGCSAPATKVNQLHNAVVEIVALKNARVNYFTLQNWYSGDEDGSGGVYNFVVKRGLCQENAEINWVQIEVGSSITWKYPSCILLGNNSKGSFFSLSLTNKNMYADTGTKMIHLGENTSSVIHAKSLSSDNSINIFRSKIYVSEKAKNSKIFSNCDSLILNEKAKVQALPTIQINNSQTKFTHEASFFVIEEEIFLFLQMKGFTRLNAQKIIVQNFALDIIEKLPDEFYLEIKPLLDLKIEGNG